MTREEAIKVLSDIDHAWRNFSQEEYVALEMAIKALKQESKVDVQKWIHTECPNLNCNYDLSTDRYYPIEDAPRFCPKCGQALLWKSEGVKK